MSLQSFSSVIDRRPDVLTNVFIVAAYTMFASAWRGRPRPRFCTGFRIPSQRARKSTRTRAFSVV